MAEGLQPVPAVSLASLEGQYYKPRLDRELLTAYSRGLIATTGCLASRDPLRLGQYDLARQAAAELADIFGRDDFYVEVMDHGSAVEQRFYDDLMRLRKSSSSRPGHQRPALHRRGRRGGTRGAAVRAVGVDAGRSEPVQGSTAPAIT